MVWTRKGSFTSAQRRRSDRPLPGTVARPEGTGSETTHPALGLFQHAATSSRPLEIREMRHGRPCDKDVQNVRTDLEHGNKSGLAIRNHFTV